MITQLSKHGAVSSQVTEEQVVSPVGVEHRVPAHPSTCTESINNCLHAHKYMYHSKYRYTSLTRCLGMHFIENVRKHVLHAR